MSLSTDIIKVRTNQRIENVFIHLTELSFGLLPQTFKSYVDFFSTRKSQISKNSRLANNDTASLNSCLTVRHVIQHAD